MATHPIGPRYPQSAASSGYWYGASPTCSRTYLAASLRAGLIALLLLAILVVIIAL